MAAEQHTTAQHGRVWVDVSDACCRHRNQDLKTRKEGYCVINVPEQKETCRCVSVEELFLSSFALIHLNAAKKVTSSSVIRRLLASHS